MNSQLIEVGIGLVLAFVVVSLASSSFVEMPSIVLRRRARGLERTVGALGSPRRPSSSTGSASGQRRSLVKRSLREQVHRQRSHRRRWTSPTSPRRPTRRPGGGTIIDLEMAEKGRSMLGPPTAADSSAAEAAADDETPPAP
jgi:hypothetical protein